MTSFFRYPGGKSKLKNFISKHLNVYSDKSYLEYREPFFGGGSVGLKFILDNPHWSKIWINDRDVGVANLWTSVIRYPDELKRMVLDFTPSTDAFHAYKKELLDAIDSEEKDDIIQCGFKKLAIHQISYSGLGTKSGGPLGGKEQKSKYKVDCRWSPEYICKKINFLHDRLSSLEINQHRCTSLDFEDVIYNEDNNAFLYLDPPYYVKGNDLYQCGFTSNDHMRLATALKETNHLWVLSYDDCPEIRFLYDWAEISPIVVNYSITATKDKESGKRESTIKQELLIYPSKHKEFIDELFP